MDLQNKKWQEPFDVYELTSHVDERGYLIELLRFLDFDIPGQGQLYTFSVNPGKRRGDHYHKRKREWFTCVSGEAIVLLSTADGQKKAVKLNADQPKLVYAGPGASHAVINNTEQTAIMVSYGSEQHNPEDEDTYRQIAYQDFNEQI